MRACQWRGPLNQAGKSQRSATGGFRSDMIREPTYWGREFSSFDLQMDMGHLEKL